MYTLNAPSITRLHCILHRYGDTLTSLACLLSVARICGKHLGRARQKLIDHPTPLSRPMPESRTQVTAAENWSQNFLHWGPCPAFLSHRRLGCTTLRISLLLHSMCSGRRAILVPSHQIIKARATD